MCIEFENFLGKWELRTGCLVAAVTGPVYATLLTLFLWLGPYSSMILPEWIRYFVIFETVYNCIVALMGFCFLYGVLKEVSWPINTYKNMWIYITLSVAGIWIGELATHIVQHPNKYMDVISTIVTLFFLTAMNFYFIMIIRSYEKETSE